MPRLRPSPIKPALRFCNVCADKLEQITHLLPPGYCANCGRKETRTEPVYVMAADAGPSSRFAIHLKCESPWFARCDAFHTMSAATIVRLFLQEERKRRQQRGQKTARQAKASNLLPPDDAA
jgi:hypothetical protein